MISEPGKSDYPRGEYFGYIVNRLVKRYLRYTPTEIDAQGLAFNYRSFPESLRRSLTLWIDKVSSIVDGHDPLQSAGDLNYIISGILWGITGDAEGVEQASYGYRAYLRGILGSIHDDINPVHAQGNAETVMSVRRCRIIRGVLEDVIDEFYRRRTSEYEEKKMIENGDIWYEGKLWTVNSVAKVEG